MTQAAIITDETRYVTGVQAIKSSRWPMGRDRFYKLVRAGLIKKVELYPGARPVFEVEQIDKLFSGAQSGA